jgi:hypothetical protein
MATGDTNEVNNSKFIRQFDKIMKNAISKAIKETHSGVKT